MCTDVYWCVLVCTDETKLYWCVLICTDLHWCVLMCTNLYWCVLVCSGVYWCVRKNERKTRNTQTLIFQMRFFTRWHTSQQTNKQTQQTKTQRNKACFEVSSDGPKCSDPDLAYIKEANWYWQVDSFLIGLWRASVSLFWSQHTHTQTPTVHNKKYSLYSTQ